MLSLEDFKKLSEEERFKRYNELSEEDRQLLRASDIPLAIPTGIEIDMEKYWAKFPERKKEIEDNINKIEELLIQNKD